MFGESDWTGQIERVKTLREEAEQRRLIRQAPRINLWARLLPLLRRLESWMERYAGTSGQGGVIRIPDEQ